MTYYQDDVLQSSFHGNLTSIPFPPSRILKVLVTSTKSECKTHKVMEAAGSTQGQERRRTQNTIPMMDFEHERKRIQEVLIPELQRHCNNLGIDVEILDVQYENDVDSTLDSIAFAHQLNEIEDGHAISVGCFLICLVGNKYKPYILPNLIDSNEFRPIRTAVIEAGLDVTLLDQWYKENLNLVPPAFVIQPVYSKYKRFRLRKPEDCSRLVYEQQIHEWLEEHEKLVKILNYGARIAFEEGLLKEDCFLHKFISGVHSQMKHALRLSKTAPERIICIVRQLEDINLGDQAAQNYLDIANQNDGNAEEEYSSGYREFLEEIVLSINRKNVYYFSVPWHESGIDPNTEEHNSYLEKFSDVFISSIKSSISDVVASPDWEEFPEDLRRTVKEVANESQAHLCNCRGNLQVLGVAQSLDSDFGPLIQIQQLMMTEDRIRHTPIIISGPAGCGKSTLLSQVFMYCMEWLGTDVIRIVRLIGQSPLSNYTSELLRNLCLHISLVFDFDISPKHHSYELGKLSIWFQDLLKLVEMTTSDLVILLDDLHELKCPPSNQSAILGWLPWNLPSNVHVICSISEEADSVLRLLKPRISTGDNFVQISPLNAQSAISMLHSNLRDSKYSLTNDQWDIIRECFSSMTVCPLYVILLSKYIKKWPSWKGIMKEQVPSNLQELVIRILIDMEDSYGVALITKIATYLTCTIYGLREAEIVELLSSMDDDSFSPSYWLSIKSSLMVLLKEYYVGGRPYLQWSHRAIAENVRKRYLSRPEDRFSCHNDLAQAFHLGYLAEKDKKEESVNATTKTKDNQSDILRELDELWFHLLQCGDLQKLKQDAICNFDFLFSATKGSSISYVRSILELVRCKFLDWEVELLYTLTKQSVDVLSQDPQQLATEIMNWLKPYADKSSPVLEGLVSNALKWCNNNKNPLLVPKNSWLSLTLPSQVTVMTCPHPIDHMVTTPDSQHVFCSHGQDVHMYHIPSKESVRSLTGHKDEITCIHMTVSGRWLISGSEDTNVIVWEVCTGKMKQRLSHHIAGVLCVTSTNSETFILSGSEVGVVIVSRLDTGQLVQRLENHRGVINCIAVNNGDDIFATGSSDCTVCISSLEDFSLLNTIHLTSSICLMDISSDSTFLLLNCEDNTVHVRSLTTGSDVHCLQGFTGSVTRLCFARDSCRCGVGTSDGKCYIYDIHSATLLQTLIGHSDPISGMQAQENDRFLISSAGIKIVVWNFSPRKKDTPIHHLKTKLRKVDSHSEPVSCVTVSRDGVFAVTGSKDCQVKVWHLNTGEIHTTLEGHCGAVTCVSFSPNGLFVVSGSDDTTLRVWGLTVGLVISTFKEHQTKVIAVAVSFDSRRILSADAQGYHRFWMADSGEQLYACIKPSAQLYLHANIVFAVSGKNENSLKFWPVSDLGAEKTVSHSDAILCYTVTHNCQTIVTGSQDMSLKVWEVATGKITQVLVGHEGAVQCVAVAPYCSSMVVSGSTDCSLIIWDMTTGADNLTLRGHTEAVKCVKLTLDGNVAVSGADDNTLQLWNTTNGQRIAMLDLHVAMVTMVTSVNVSDIVVQLVNQQQLSILSLHNNPAKGLTLEPPTCLVMSEETKLTGLPARGVLPKRVLLRGNLKREQSFDSLYWDLRSSIPRLEPSTGLDDFKRSLMGSREQLSHVGVWDGSVGRVRSIQQEGLPLQPKPKLPKHKLLKKQQSMFAFFPEFSSQPKSITQTSKMELETKQELPRTPETVHECPSRSESSEDVDNPESHVDRKSASVKDSSVCRIV